MRMRMRMILVEVEVLMMAKLEMVTDGGRDVRGALKVMGTTECELRGQCFSLNSGWKVLSLKTTELEAVPKETGPQALWRCCKTRQ